MSEYRKHFAELDLQHGGKTAGIDMIWRNYVTVTLCIHGDAQAIWPRVTRISSRERNMCLLDGAVIKNKVLAYVTYVN